MPILVGQPPPCHLTDASEECLRGIRCESDRAEANTLASLTVSLSHSLQSYLTYLTYLMYNTLPTSHHRPYVLGYTIPYEIQVERISTSGKNIYQQTTEVLYIPKVEWNVRINQHPSYYLITLPLNCEIINDFLPKLSNPIKGFLNRKEAPSSSPLSSLVTFRVKAKRS